MLYRLIRLFILRLVRLFYPRIEVQGREHLPSAGPLLFVLNHPNGLIDALVLMIGLRRRVAFLAKSTFFANPLLRLCLEAFAAVPVYRRRDTGKTGGPQGDVSARNAATFARCRALLQRGEAVALFPEGTTHAGARRLPLRPGAARLALSAEVAAGGRLGVQLVPVGLWYEQKARFRSAALLVIGPSFGLTDLLVDYAADPRPAVEALTVRIGARLDDLVLQADDAAELNALLALAAWTLPPATPPTLAGRYAHAARLQVALARLKTCDPARAAALARQARRYARVLRRLGVADPWALEAPPPWVRTVGRALALAVGAPPALAGLALSWPARLAGPLAERLFGKSDEMTITGKLVIGAGLVGPGWGAAGLAAGARFGARRGALLLVAAPLLAYTGLRWVEGRQALQREVAAVWLHRRRPALAAKLIARRQALAAAVESISTL